MNFYVALYAYLQSKALLTALIATRLYPSIAPQGTDVRSVGSYVIYAISGEEHTTYMGGESSLKTYFVSFMLVAATTTARQTLRDAFKNVLEGRINENLTDGTVTAKFESWFLNRQDGYQAAQDARELGVFTTMLDYKFTFNDVLPTLP